MPTIMYTYREISRAEGKLVTSAPALTDALMSARNRLMSKYLIPISHVYIPIICPRLGVR